MEKRVPNVNATLTLGKTFSLRNNRSQSNNYRRRKNKAKIEKCKSTSDLISRMLRWINE